MTSLSRIIKSHSAYYGSVTNKVLALRSVTAQKSGVMKEEASTIPLPEDLLEEARMKAEEMIMQANEQAALIREEIETERAAWEQERNAMSEKACREGFDAGFKHGMEHGQNEYQEMIRLAKATAEDARSIYYKTIKEAERTILDISIEVAEKIMAHQLYGDENPYFAFVRNAIKESREYKNIELHIHPAHYEHINRKKDELISLFPRETAFYIYPDEELSEGDCYIESSNGRLNASVDIQLAQIKKILLEVLEEERG